MNTPIPSPTELWSTMPGGHFFQDVTQLIDLAAQAMRPGQVFAMQHFTLFDAMNAIEIMDPRMDNGVVPTPSQLTMDPSLPPPPPFDPKAPLSPEEISWILDRSIAAEMDWHSGRFMANSIHTLQYVHHLLAMNDPTPLSQSDEDMQTRPKDLIPSVLRPCVIGMLKTCDLAWRQLSQAFVYDGEDYHSEKFEVSLCESFQSQKVLELLDGAESWLMASPELPHRDILLIRVQFRKSLLRVFSDPPDIPGGSQLVHLHQALSLLDAIVSSPQVAAPSPTSPARAAFDPAIGRNLVVVTPLRSIALSSQAEAWRMLKEMLDGLVNVYSIADRGTSLDWMTLLVLQARGGTSLPRGAFVRSATAAILRNRPPRWLLDLIYSHMVPIPQAYLMTLASTLSHPLLYGSSQDPRKLVNALVGLQQRIQEVLEHFFLTLNQNRPRCRRNLSKVFYAWHKIEEDAIEVMRTIREPMQHDQDAVLATLRLPKVIHHIRLMLIVEYVLSGFELDLYTPSEWPFLYWYLVGLIEGQLKTIGDLQSGGGEGEWLGSYVKWCQALKGMCLARFLSLTPLINTSALFPRLDRERLRINLLKRFDWSDPPTDEQGSSTLADEAKPNWEAYETAVARWMGKENQERVDVITAAFSSARMGLTDLRGLVGDPTASGLCEDLWVDFTTGLIRACTRLLRMQQIDGHSPRDDDEADGQEVHPWFPVVPSLQ